MVAYDSMFCVLLFISVGCISLLLCFLIVMHVLFSTLTEVFPYFSLSCMANARVYLAKTGHSPHSSLIVLFHVLNVLSMYCFCVNVYYCQRVSTQLQLNIYHIILYHKSGAHNSILVFR